MALIRGNARALEIFGAVFEKLLTDRIVLCLFGLRGFEIRSRRLARIGRRGGVSARSSALARPCMELDRIERGLLLGSHALLGGKARVDAVGLLAEAHGAPLFMHAETFGDVLPRQRGNLLTVRRAQIEPFFFLWCIHGHPDRIFLRTAQVDLPRGFVCVAFLLFELQRRCRLLALVEVLDAAHRFPFGGVLFLDDLIGGFARASVKLPRPFLMLELRRVPGIAVARRDRTAVACTFRGAPVLALRAARASPGPRARRRSAGGSARRAGSRLRSSLALYVYWPR